jgi:hypothetical protein
MHGVITLAQDGNCSKQGSKTQEFCKRHEHIFTNGGMTLLHAVRYYAQISPLLKSESYRSRV